MHADASAVTFRILGPLEVEVDGRPVALGTPQRRAVCALLLLDANRLVSVQRLVDALWSQRPPNSARTQIHARISELRRAFATSGVRNLIATGHQAYKIRLAQDSLDLTIFRQHVDAGRTLLAAGEISKGGSRLRHALDLWRGDAFADLTLPAIRAASRRLDEERLAAIDARVTADLALGHGSHLIAELTDLLDRTPLNERLAQHLMTALHDAGRTADALAVFRATRTALRDEIGVDPSAELTHLHEQILKGERTASLTAPPPQAPQQTTPRMLPPALVDFAGREGERREVEDHLRGESPAWVLLCGQAGLGKTALAIRAAHDVADAFPDGQLFARLSHTDGAPLGRKEVLGHLLRSLGLTGASVPTEFDDMSAVFRSVTSGKRILVVLDDAADEQQAGSLLPGGPDCGVLITSRRRLAGLDNVVRVALGPMTEGDSRDLLSAAVGQMRLAAEPEAAGKILELCAGLPLALKVVAATLVARLDWPLGHAARLLADERHRLNQLKYGDLEVRANLMLSYAQLTPDERRLFRLLGLVDASDFPGWVVVALTELPPDEADQHLGGLLNTHLVTADVACGGTSRRYRMHSLVRLLARELSGEESEKDRTEAVARVVEGYLSLAGAAAKWLPQRFAIDALPNLWCPSDVIVSSVDESKAWFAAERMVIAAMLKQAVREDLTSDAWRLFQRLTCYLAVIHDLVTIEDLSDHLMPAVRGAGDLHGEAALLCIRSLPMGFRDQFSQMLPLARRALAIRKKIGNPAGRAEAHQLLGSVLVMLGRFEDGRQELNVALRLSREIGDHVGASRCLYFLASRDGVLSDVATRLKLLDEAATEAKTAGSSTGWILAESGVLLATQNRLDEAERKLVEARAACELQGETWRAAVIGADLAHVYVDLGRLDEAAELIEHAKASGAEHHDLFGEGVILTVRSRLAHARGRHHEAINLARRAMDQWRQLPDPPSGCNAAWRGPEGLSDLLAPDASVSTLSGRALAV